MLGGGGPFATRTVTREVVREVPVEPVAPQPFACRSWGRSYLPVDHHFTCPSCGAPAPPGLIVCAHCGQQYVPTEHHDVCPDCGTAAPTRTA
jgi:Zn finger protein HypA/HybF involved in hydrogenase expression